jgi:hypothetical protein
MRRSHADTACCIGTSREPWPVSHTLGLVGAPVVRFLVWAISAAPRPKALAAPRFLRPYVFAEFETNLRRECQLEGIAKAKAVSVYKGPSFEPAEARLKAEGLGASAIAKRLGIGRASVYRVLDDERKSRSHEGCDGREQHRRVPSSYPLPQGRHQGRVRGMSSGLNLSRVLGRLQLIRI